MALSLVSIVRFRVGVDGIHTTKNNVAAITYLVGSIIVGHDLLV